MTDTVRAAGHERLFDQDGDDRISREEYRGGRVFVSATSPNPDRRTLNAMSSELHTHRFARLSRGGQPLTRGSLAGEAAQTFRAHDLDRDGQLTPADMAGVSRGEPRR